MRRVAAAGIGRSHAPCTTCVSAALDVSTRSRKRKNTGEQK